MYYKLKYGKNYIFKIVLLVLSALLAEYFIWWAMVREESVDWLAGHINHIPSPYAISEMDDGRKIVGNVILGFELVLSDNWNVENSKNPSFFYNEEDTICKINTDIRRNTGIEETEKYKVFKKNDFLIYSKENNTESGEYLYEYLIEVEDNFIIYNLSAEKENKNICRNEFEKTIKTWFYYPVIVP
jgi:hypothetical protein